MGTCFVGWSREVSPSILPNLSTELAAPTNSPYRPVRGQKPSRTQATETQADLTVLSVDGVGAYDTISRNSMLRGHHTVPSANQCLPFVRQFYTQPSHYVWHDDANQAHIITQAEGGEQGDPLMPALFALGQRAALADVQQQLHLGEHLFAFLDDVYALVPPDRVQHVYALLEHHLFQHAHIQLHRGKARVWNRAGLQPPHIQHLGPEAWVGDPALPPSDQGLAILGSPLGSPAFVAQQLQEAVANHAGFLSRIPLLQDLQASWLLLLFCASPRCNYQLRMLAPSASEAFAHSHDHAIAGCLTELLQTGPVPATSLAIAHLPLSEGGLGLTAASVTAPAAYWGSWADTLQFCMAKTRCSQPSSHTVSNTQGKHPEHCKQPRQRQKLSAIMGGTRPDGKTFPPEAPHHRHNNSTKDPELGDGNSLPQCHSTKPSGQNSSKLAASQPSSPRIPKWAVCQQSFHHRPLWARVHIFFRALPPLTPPATPPALAIVCALLSMPSHS